MLAPMVRGDPLVFDGPEAKRSYVREAFSEIAPRYDLLNRVLSLGVDERWRARAVDRLGWEERPQGTFLDVCAGTMDLGAELAGRPRFRGAVVGADFALPMLRRGRGKGARLQGVGADAERLPFPAEAFDGAMVAFGVRNLAGLDAGLLEMVRVVRSGGTVVVLEFSEPRPWPVRPLFLWYFRRVLPAIGRMVSGHRDAYRYLPASVRTFPEPEELARRIADAGCSDVRWERLTFGIVTLHWGRRR